MRIVGISGSLRRGSYNTALLRVLSGMMPEGSALEIHTYADLPLYNADVDGAEAPEAATRLRRRIAAADAVLFASPEYNFGISGVLKNAIDWASRPAFRAALTHKPVGIVSASRGTVGGARAQLALRQVLGGTLSPVFPHGDVLVGAAHEKLDDQGKLSDPTTEEHLRKYARAFVAWVGAQKPAASQDGGTSGTPPRN